ncbi:MAG: thioredoxin-disulfide reductase [Fusicatenibacter sp.]|nr:thioredoxin-disulfide reductase [Fusicatenibacter sp.]
MTEQIYDVIVIGSGPAGLAAAIYAKRAKLESLVIEANYVSGGQVITTYEVDNYPGLPGISGMDLGNTLREHAEKMGAVFARERVKELELDGDVKIVRTRKKEYHTKTVILATGAQHRMLGVPGEKELSGMGVSYCATCDGAFFKGKTVAVVGGGDVAVEDAIFLARTCEKVYVIHRRDSLRAAAVLSERLLALPNVEMVWDTVVDSIEGENSVEAVRITNIKTGESRELDVQGVFIAVGITPNSGLAEGKVSMDESGYLIAGEDGVTSVPGLFVAGDVRTKQLRQIITAASDGANCITSVERYLVSLG